MSKTRLNIYQIIHVSKETYEWYKLRSRSYSFSLEDRSYYLYFVRGVYGEYTAQSVCGIDAYFGKHLPGFYVKVV